MEPLESREAPGALLLALPGMLPALDPGANKPAMLGLHENRGVAHARDRALGETSSQLWATRGWEQDRSAARQAAAARLGHLAPQTNWVGELQPASFRSVAFTAVHWDTVDSEVPESDGQSTRGLVEGGIRSAAWMPGSAADGGMPTAGGQPLGGGGGGSPSNLGQAPLESNPAQTDLGSQYAAQSPAPAGLADLLANGGSQAISPEMLAALQAAENDGHGAVATGPTHEVRKGLGFSAGWTSEEFGGAAPDAGSVTLSATSAVLREGNSLLTTLTGSFVVPESPLRLTFDYTDLSFDTRAEGQMRDAFEAVLYDASGAPLTHGFAAGREAFLNLGETSPAALGSETSQAGGRVSVDLSGLFAGTEARLAFRLVNNDQDDATSVRISNVAIVSEGIGSEPPQVSLALASDTGSDPLDRLTSNPSVTGQTSGELPIGLVKAGLDAAELGDFADVTSTLQANGSFTLSSSLVDQLAGGVLADGAHTLHVIATDTSGSATAADLAFTLDRTLPNVSVALINDTGANTHDGVTSDPTTGGTVSDASAIVSLRGGLDGTASQAFVDLTAKLAGDGTFVLDADTLSQLTGGPLGDGPHTLHLEALDAAGNVRTADLAFVLDTKAITATLELAHDTAPSGTPPELYSVDRLTNDPTLHATVADPGRTARVLLKLDDGAFLDLTSKLSAGELVYTPPGLAPGLHSALLRVEGVGGNTSDTALQFTLNTPPILDVAGQLVLAEGDVLFLDASGSSDAEGALYDYRWTFHDGAVVADPSVTRVYPQDGGYPLQVTIEDTAGSQVSQTLQVVVNNAPPLLAALPARSVSAGSMLDVDAQFSDRGALDTHLATIDWGDGSPLESLKVTEQGGAGDALGSHAYANPGNYLAKVTLVDSDGAQVESGFAVQVGNRAPVVVVDTTPRTVQYSDSLAPINIQASDDPGDLLRASAKYRVANGPWTTGLPAGLALTGSGGAGTGAWQIAGNVQVAPGDYVLRIAVADAGGAETASEVPLRVNAEDASAVYTGVRTLSTASKSSSQLTIPLRAVIRDITAVSPSSDSSPGDIRNARVKLVDRNTGGVIASGLPVSLLDPNDLKSGVVTFDWTVNLGSASSKQFRVGVVVEGHYTGVAADAVIQVSKPTTLKVTGGGYLVQQTSAGTYAGARGEKANFELEAQFNSQLTQLKGSIQLSTRHAGRELQIDSTALQSLGIDATTGRVTLLALADLDIEDHDYCDDDHDGDHRNASSQGNDGRGHEGHTRLTGLRLEATLIDRGEPGRDDAIGFSLWKGAELLYASAWDGVQAVEQKLGGGNLQVHKPTAAAADAAAGNQLQSISAAPRVLGASAIAPIELSITSPTNAPLTPGSAYLLTGRAAATDASTQVTAVTVNGRPVDTLDAAGNFFHRIEILPGDNRLTVAAAASSGALQTAEIMLRGVAADSTKLDTGRLTDVSASVDAKYGRTSFEALPTSSGTPANVLLAGVALHNSGTYPLRTPLLVGVKNISDPRVSLRDFDGKLPDATPYYDLSRMVAGGLLATGAVSDELTLAFDDPQRLAFSYELVVLAALNQPPAITSAPDAEAILGHNYVYQVEASDPEGDALHYSLLSAPAGMQINATTGRITWTPATVDEGTHLVTVEVGDSVGGGAQQTYVLSAIQAPPNRPPFFTSNPVVAAQVGSPYAYQATARDADDDPLSFALTVSPTRATIDQASGQISWTPAAAALGPQGFTLSVSDGRGGATTQAFQVLVSCASDNHDPVIVSGDTASYALPRPSNPAQGDVAPTAIHTNLLAGQSVDQHVSLTLPTVDPPATTADVVIVTQERPSMGGEFQWIADVAPRLDSALNGLGLDDNRFGLVGASNFDGNSVSQANTVDVQELSGLSLTQGYLGNGGYLGRIASGDLDHDGDADIVAASWDNVTVDGVSVFLNNGDGSFAPRQTLGTGLWSRIQEVVVADLDHDGILMPR